MKVRWTDSVAAQPPKSARTYHSKRPGVTVAVYEVSAAARSNVGVPPAGASHNSYSMAFATASQLNTTVALVTSVSFAGPLNCGAPWLAQSCAGRTMRARCPDWCDAQPSNNVSTYHWCLPGGMISVSDVSSVLPRF